MKFIRLSGFVIILLVLSGCGYIASQEDVSSVKGELDQRVDTLEKNVGNNYKYFNEKTSGLEKSQVDTRANLMQVSEDIRNQLKELRSVFDDKTNEISDKLDQTAKSQDTKNFEFRRDIGTSQKSQNDFLVSLSALNTEMTDLQNDLSAVKKTESQQSVQNTEAVNGIISKQDELLKSLGSLKSETNDKIKIMLDELVRQESEIFIMRKQLDGLSARRPAESTATETVKEIKYYTVKKGDSLGKIAKKLHVSLADLCKANNLKKTDKAVTGKKLVIP